VREELKKLMEEVTDEEAIERARALS